MTVGHMVRAVAKIEGKDVIGKSWNNDSTAGKFLVFLASSCTFLDDLELNQNFVQYFWCFCWCHELAKLMCVIVNTALFAAMMSY